MNYDEMKRRVKMIEERQIRINTIQAQLAVFSKVELCVWNGITVRELVEEGCEKWMKVIFLEGLKDRLAMLKKEMVELESAPEGGTKL